jgi:hypothetical protein
MKKLVAVIMMLLTFTLSACGFTVEEGTEESSSSELTDS